MSWKQAKTNCLNRIITEISCYRLEIVALLFSEHCPQHILWFRKSSSKTNSSCKKYPTWTKTWSHSTIKSSKLGENAHPSFVFLQLLVQFQIHVILRNEMEKLDSNKQVQELKKEINSLKTQKNEILMVSRFNKKNLKKKRKIDYRFLSNLRSMTPSKSTRIVC